MQQTDEDDVVSAASELDGIASEFFLFGCALGIARGMMKQLQDNYRHKQRQGLQAVLDEYVLGNHDTDKFGHPTWRNIIAAVSNPMGGNNHRLAKKIAANHGCKCMLTACICPALLTMSIITMVIMHAY